MAHIWLHTPDCELFSEYEHTTQHRTSAAWQQTESTQTHTQSVQIDHTLTDHHTA